MPVGSGFTVHHGGLDTAAGRLDRAASDLEVVRGRLQYPPEYTADHYGDYGAAEAAGNFITSWQDEMLLDVQALHDLAGRLRQTASNYRTADHAVAGSFAR